MTVMIGKEVRPEDFAPDSIWHELVKRHGSEPYLDLFLLAGGTKVYIPSHEWATRAARFRVNKKRFTPTPHP